MTQCFTSQQLFSATSFLEDNIGFPRLLEGKDLAGKSSKIIPNGPLPTDITWKDISCFTWAFMFFPSFNWFSSEGRNRGNFMSGCSITVLLPTSSCSRWWATISQLVWWSSSSTMRVIFSWQELGSISRLTLKGTLYSLPSGLCACSSFGYIWD